MRQVIAVSASFFLLAGLFLGCTRQPDVKVAGDKLDAKIDPPKVKINPPKTKVPPIGKPVAKIDDEKQEKYEAALADALSALAERKFDDALTAFETARTFNDTPFVQDEITKLKLRLDQDGAAKSTVKNIETVLNDGDAENALGLIKNALKEFGDGDDAPEFVKLKLQAEALQDVAKPNEDKEARYQRFRKEGEAALEEKNLRAAAIAFEQALQSRADAGLQTKYDEIRGKLDTYDDLRKKAAEMRRDPAQLDDALDALQKAFAAWETLQVKTDIDDVQLALQKRRDTASVVNFEVRNDVGLPNAGAVLADEILPALKAKFDLVDRDQLNRVLTDLNAPQNFVDDPKQQFQVGKLAKVRYLVAGSINRLVVVTIRARLIDLKTGLVVQTARVSAPTIQEAIDLAPELAKQLMMTDAEKLEADAVQANAKPAALAPDNAAIPPPPPAPAPDAAPPAPINFNGGPPAFGKMNADAFKVFAPPPANFVPLPIDPLQAQQRDRMLFATVELGDFLFRAGRFGEAQRQFEFAVQLAPGNIDLQIRLDRVRPLAPAPVVFGPRPRAVFLPFGTFGDPRIVPPSLAYWTPQNLAPYFAWRFDVVDPAEIYWYMARMGLTMNDLMVDPNARRWLGRATGVRYFVLGSLVQTTSFDANVFLVDAELGYLQGRGSINVRDPFELKLRMPELAQLTLMSPEERAAYLAAQAQQRYLQLVADGRRHLDEGRYADAVRELDEALSLRPGNVLVRFWLVQARERLQFQGYVFAQRQQLAAQQAAQAAARQRQLDLANAAELARRRAIAVAAARTPAQNQIHIDLRLRAQSSLFTQAQLALNTKRFGISVTLFRSATTFAPPAVVGAPPPQPPPAAVYQDFARARFEVERAAQVRNAELARQRETDLRKLREMQLAKAQQALALEKQKNQAASDAERLALQSRDKQAFDAGIAQGNRFRLMRKFEPALVAYQSAQQFAHTPQQTKQANSLISIVVQEQAEALAKTVDEKKALETRLAAEQERRKAAETLAKKNEGLYRLALQAGDKALTAKNLTLAESKFAEAGKLFRTDAVLNGLKQVDSARAVQSAAAKKVQLEANKADDVKQLLATGNTALQANQYPDAVKAFQSARSLDPTNLTVIADLTRAEEARDRAEALARRNAETSDRTQTFQRLLKSGQANLAAKQYEAAVASLSEAAKLNPTDANVRSSLKQAEAGRDATLKDPKSQALAKTRMADYQKLITTGRLALNGNRYTDAIKSFNAAQKILPGDKASLDYLQEAESAKKDAEAALASAAAKRAEEIKSAAAVKKSLNAARIALAADNLTAAKQALSDAQKLNAKDADVIRLARDLDQAEARLAGESLALKKKQQQFDGLLSAGKKALAGKRYDDALKALASATALMPADKEAQDLYRRAQTEAREAEAALGKSKAAFQLALGVGQKALKSRDYDAAIQAFQKALDLMPDDTATAKLLKQAQQQKAAAGQNAVKFQAAMSAGQKAMKANNFDLAVRSFAAANKLDPTDTDARKLLAEAQQALARARTQAAVQANYNKAIFSGQAALKANRAKDAVSAFKYALQLIPNDQKATQLLQQAQKLLDMPKGKTTQPPKNASPYEEAMKRAANLEGDKKFGDAMKAYQEALKYRAKDAQALAGIRRNQFEQHMALGEQYADNAMWANAIREASAAVRIFPNNSDAQKLLKRAQAKKK